MSKPVLSLRPSSRVVFGIAVGVACQTAVVHIPGAIAQTTPSADSVSPSLTASLPMDGADEAIASESIGLDFGLNSLTGTTSPSNQVTSTVPNGSKPETPPVAIAPNPAISQPAIAPKAVSSSASSFSLDLEPTAPVPAPPAPAPSTAASSSDSGLPPALASLFVGDSNSLAAIAIGAAEGTRTPEGGKTWAFKGHTDPGNGVWNLGTFSWQHGASSPEEADRKQLARLQRQAAVLNRQALAMGVPWGLEEQLNALDLANQSPSAALNRGGFMERMKQAHDDGLSGTEAILWARTWSYRHPSGTRWNAPGLGNTHHGIRTDQKRRMDEIGEAIAAQRPSPPALNPSTAPGEAIAGEKQLWERRWEQHTKETNFMDRLMTLNL